MDQATREMIGACYIAVCDAAGIGVLDTANATLMNAVKNGGISDPTARKALEALVEACQPPDTTPALTAAMVNVEESVGALSHAIGDESVARISKHISRRIGRINPLTPKSEIKAIIEMVEALDAALDRIHAAHQPPVEA
jgi:hypothetical protein